MLVFDAQERRNDRDGGRAMAREIVANLEVMSE